MLLLLSGLPGSGKTTLAKAYAARYGVAHLNSDVLRREMGLMGHYRPEDKEIVYRTLLERTRQLLEEGKDVVVDSTFYKTSIREPFQQVGAACKAKLLWVELRANEENIRQRLKTPRPDSEADFDVYQKIRDAYEPIGEPHLVLQTDEMTPDELVAAIYTYVSGEKTTT